MLFKLTIIGLSLFLAIVPVSVWLWFYRGLDKKNPEPKNILAKLLLGGGAVTFLSVFIFLFLNKAVPSLSSLYLAPISFFIVVVILTPVLEECLKFFTTRAIVWKSKSFDQIIDGMVYGICIGLGFAAIENFFYFLYPPAEQLAALILPEVNSKLILVNLPSTFFIRGFFTALVHLCASGIAGLYIGKARFNSSGQLKLITTGLFLAFAIHIVYNLFAFLDRTYLAYIFIVIISYFVLLRFFKKEYQRIH